MTSPHTRITHQDVDFDELLEDPAVAAAADDAAVRYDLLKELVRTRNLAGMSQKEVASSMETTQSAVSEFESCRTDPHFSTIQRYARAVGARVSVSLEGRTDWKWANPAQSIGSVSLSSTPAEFINSGYLAVYAQYGTAERRSNYAKAA